MLTVVKDEMPGRQHPALRVVRLDDPQLNFWLLGRKIHEIVSKNPDLAVDFPDLHRWHATPSQSGVTLESRLELMHDSNGQYVMYIVFYGRTAIGAATAEQAELRQQFHGPALPPCASGPWLAYWLDENRPREQRHIGVEMLQQIAADLVDNEAMQDNPFTVVRPDNERSLGILINSANGFGGFTVQDKPQTYRYMNGGQVRGALLVARSLDDLRAEHV